MKKLLFVILFICCAQIIFASYQRADIRPVDTFKRYQPHIVDEYSLLAAYNIGVYSYGELGLAHSNFIGSCFPISAAYHFSSEFRMGDRLILGPKIGCWFGCGFAFGVNAIYYTDLTEGSLRFRPEFGIGLKVFKIVYGYNSAITNRHFPGINTNVISFTALIPVKKIRESGVK